MQPALGVPLGLEDRLLGPPATRRRVGAVLQRRDPELGPVPGHVRVVPAGPGEPAAVGADPGEGVEVAPGGEHGRLAGAVEGERDDLVLGFAARRGPRARRRRVRPSGRAGCRRSAGRPGLSGSAADRDRLLAEPLAVEPLVGEVGEEDEVVGDQRPGAAAVLVDAGADVGSRRRHRLRARRRPGAASAPRARPRPAALRAHQTAPSPASCGAARRRPAAATTAGAIGERQEP